MSKTGWQVEKLISPEVSTSRSAERDDSRDNLSFISIRFDDLRVKNHQFDPMEVRNAGRVIPHADHSGPCGC